MRGDGRIHVVGKADGLEHPQCLMIERDRARLVVDISGTLDNGDLQAISGKKVGEDGANGTEADDRDVVISSFVHRA